MDWHDSLRPAANTALEIGGIHIEAVGDRVAENRTRAHVDHNRGRSRKSVRGDQHLIPWLNSYGIERKLQRRSARVHCNSMLAPDISGELAFKLLCQRAACEPPGVKCLLDGFHFFGPDRRSMKRNECVRHLCSLVSQCCWSLGID